MRPLFECNLTVDPPPGVQHFSARRFIEVINILKSPANSFFSEPQEVLEYKNAKYTGYGYMWSLFMTMLVFVFFVLCSDVRLPFLFYF